MVFHNTSCVSAAKCRYNNSNISRQISRNIQTDVFLVLYGSQETFEFDLKRLVLPKWFSSVVAFRRDNFLFSEE